MRRLALAAGVMVCLLFASAAVAEPAVAEPAVVAQAAPPAPSSMAAIGDSMTRAADACCWYGDHPSNSWSTGAAGWKSARMG